MNELVKQPHIGRQVSHYENVDVMNIQAVFSDDKKYRYRLSIPFYSETARTKTVAVILKNPSSADEKKADKTVQNVEKVIYKTFEDAKSVEILNLFSLRGTYPKDIMETHKEGKDIVGRENNVAFEEVLSKSDYVVIAWGGAAPINKSLYNARINSVFDMFEASSFTSKLFRKQEKGSDIYPFHACYWPDNQDFIEVFVRKIN